MKKMKEVTNSWVVTIAVNYFVFKVTFVMFQFSFNVGKLSIKLVFLLVFA
jgi:hypothetical protein